MIIFSLVIFFITSDKNPSKKYISPKYDGEKITPGHFDEN